LREGPSRGLRQWAGRTRAHLAGEPNLRAAFDRCWSGPTTWLFSTALARRRYFPWAETFERDVLINPWGSGLGETSAVPALARRGIIESSDVLVIGVQHGDEIETLWVPWRPKSIVGIDIGDYAKDWVNTRKRWPNGTRAEFAKMDGSKLAFAPSTFDVVYCQGVLPHVMDLPAFVDEVHRVLRPGGIFVAISCPPWRTYEGPHMPGLGFDHLLLSEAEFHERVSARQDGWEHWYQVGLFNRLTVREMIATIDQRFDVRRLAIAPSRGASRFRQSHPNDWTRLTAEFEPVDLMVRLFLLEAIPRLRPPVVDRPKLLKSITRPVGR
jgi:SAM-dependent methyltransferase